MRKACVKCGRCVRHELVACPHCFGVVFRDRTKQAPPKPRVTRGIPACVQTQAPAQIPGANFVCAPTQEQFAQALAEAAARPVSAPAASRTDVCVLVDVSGSVQIAYNDGVIGRAYAAQTGVLNRLSTGYALLGHFSTCASIGETRTRFPESLPAPAAACDPWQYTAMRDAIFLGHKRLLALAGAGAASRLIIVITDGIENSSTVNVFDLARAIGADSALTVSIVGPPDVKRHAETWGVKPGNILEWSGNAQKLDAETTAPVTRALNSYYAAREKGAKAVGDFFVDITASVQTALGAAPDLRTPAGGVKYVKHVVGGKVAISVKEFVESALGLPYSPGMLYYQFVRDTEELHAGKRVLFAHKKTHEIKYVERSVLGLPAATCEVRPGDFGVYDVFAQSTSYSRLLPPRTSVIVCVPA